MNERGLTITNESLVALSDRPNITYPITLSGLNAVYICPVDQHENSLIAENSGKQPEREQLGREVNVCASKL